jgi:hypothetical protein
MGGVAIAGLIISGVSAAASYKQGRDAAKEARRKQNEYNQRVKETTLANLANLNKEKLQAVENVAKDKLQNNLDFLEERSRSRNVAGAIGARGQSFDNLMNDLDVTYFQREADIEESKEDLMRDFDRQSEAIKRGEEAALDTRYISKPSAFGAGANILGAAYQGYNTGKEIGSAYDEWVS